MVDRILDAAAAVLAEDGYQAASTNRIAERAGVSPGSVYRYFDDKRAIVRSLSHRLTAEFARELTPALRQSAARSRSEATRLVIQAVLDALDRQAPLLRAIADRVPAEEQARALTQVHERLVDMTYRMVAIHGGVSSPEELELATWTIVEASQHLAVRYVLDTPPFSQAAFVDALERIVGALLPATR